MHTFISMIKRSLDEYNEFPNKDVVALRMMNAIVLSMIIYNDGNIDKKVIQVSSKMNYLWQRYIRAKIHDVNYVNHFHAITKCINIYKDEIFRMINLIVEEYDYKEADIETVDQTYEKGVIMIEVR